MKTPITYYGGKQTMLKYIIPLIPKHKLYTEAFCGGAAVLFAKEKSEGEVINDINMELTNFYWVAKTNYDALKAEIEKTLHGRDMHDLAAFIYTHPSFFSYAQRAWTVWMLCKTSFASKLNGPFGYDLKGSMTKRMRNGKDYFTSEICDRLDNVTIENRDAIKVISTYDTPDTFHFIDPPYIGSNCGHYTGTFGEYQMNELLTLLESLKGKFMLTMYPYDPINDFAIKNGWVIHKVERTLSASKTTRKKHEEWMVCNYTQKE